MSREQKYQEYRERGRKLLEKGGKPSTEELRRYGQHLKLPQNVIEEVVKEAEKPEIQTFMDAYESSQGKPTIRIIHPSDDDHPASKRKRDKDVGVFPTP